MKRILLLTSLLVSAAGFSQLALKRHNGTPITNGQVIAFNTTTAPAAELDFNVVNTSASSVNVRINCTALVNNDGTGFELCFADECLSSVEEGTNYPVNTSYLTLAAGAQSGNDGHFLNTPFAAVTAPFPKDYSFRFFQAGNPTNFVDVTYRYDPNLSIDDINQLQTSGVIIKSTTVRDELVLDVLKNSSMSIYDLNGKMVQSSELTYGIQTVNVSNLMSGVYVVSFTNDMGSASKKIIKN